MNVNTAARKGRFGDEFLAHVSPNERVIPPRELFPENVNDQIDSSFEALGLNPDRYEVGSDASSINPETGMPEYFWQVAIPAAISAAATIGGGMLASSAQKKAQKRAERKAGEVLGNLNLSPGFFEGPYASGHFGQRGTYTPIGSASAAGRSPGDLSRMAQGFGGGYTFSPEMQKLWGSGLDRANITGDLFNQFVGPDYFTKGPMFDMFNQSRIGRVQRGEDSAANAISQLFNRGGMHTASMMDMSKIQADLNAAKAQEDAAQLFNMQKFLGTGLDQSKTALDYLNSMNTVGLDAYGRAQDASTIGTQLDIGKAAGMLGVISNQPSSNWGDIVSSVGQDIAGGVSNYQMGQMLKGLGGGGGSPNQQPFFTSSQGQFSPQEFDWMQGNQKNFNPFELDFDASRISGENRF